MVVGEPSLMGGEFGDEDERLITRLENTQYDPSVSLDDPSGLGGGGMGGGMGGGGGPPSVPPSQFNSGPPGNLNLIFSRVLHHTHLFYNKSFLTHARTNNSPALFLSLFFVTFSSN